MSDWYDAAAILLYVEHSWSGGTPDEVPPGPTEDAVRGLLDRIRPDALQVTAKGQAGFVPYPTRFGNRWPALDQDPWRDPLEVYVDAAARGQLPLILAYSSLVDHHQAYWRAEWQRVTSRRQPYRSQALCPNSGYIEELLLPQLDELVERYSPAGICLDGENWTVSPCYCAACETEFQMLHERSAPLEPADLLWEDWLRFQRDSFHRYLARVARYLHDRQPDLLFASNAGFASHQPEPAPDGCGRGCWDLSPAFSHWQAGLEARVFDGRRMPFDLMTWDRCSPRPWPTGSQPALPAYPKSAAQLQQEGALILANGGKWTLWVTARKDGEPPEDSADALAAAAQFGRERTEWLGGTESAADVAIVHTDATHRKAGNGLYDPGPSLDRIRGAHQALVELHLPHDVVAEGTLRDELERYRLLILPEQIEFPEWFDSRLADWVQNGGRLLATGRVSPRLQEAVPVFALEELLGVRWTGAQHAECATLLDGAPLRVVAPIYEVTLYEAEEWLPMLALAGAASTLHQPFATGHVFGSGAAAYVAADLFAAYHRSQYPGLRRLLGGLLDRLHPERLISVTASPTVECVLRRRPGEWLLHLIEHSPGKSLAQNSAFIEDVPCTAPINVRLRLGEDPVSVQAQPGNTPIAWSRDGDAIQFLAPSFGTHVVISILTEENPIAGDE